jgi:hypothetical protein
VLTGLQSYVMAVELRVELNSDMDVKLYMPGHICCSVKDLQELYTSPTASNEKSAEVEEIVNSESLQKPKA